MPSLPDASYGPEFKIRSENSRWWSEIQDYGFVKSYDVINKLPNH